MTDIKTQNKDNNTGNSPKPSGSTSRMNKRLEIIKGRLPIYIALLAMTLAAMWLVNRCTHPKDALIANEYIRPQGDTLSVAIEMSPMTYFYSGDTISGFDYEMLRQICAAHKRPVVFQPFAPLDYAFEGLEAGKFDLVIANLPATSEIRQKFAATEAVFTDRAVLVQQVHPDSTSKIHNGRELSNHEVWIAENSPLRTRLENLAAESGDSISIKSDPKYNSELLCIMVAQGKIERAVVNQSVARQMATDYSNLDISTPISFSQFQTWLVKSDNSKLLATLNQWIAEFKQQPSYEALLEQYGF